METLYIAIVAVSATLNQRAVIEKVTNQAITCLSDRISLVEPDQAQMVLIWLNSEADLAVLTEYQENYPTEQLIVIGNEAMTVQSYWHLSFPEEAIMPSTLKLSNFFSRILSFLSPLEAPEFKDVFDFSDSLLGVVQDAINDGLARICSHPFCPDLYLLPKERAVYFHGKLESLVPMALTGRNIITINEVSDKQVHDAVSYVQFSSRLSQYVFLEEEKTLDDLDPNHYSRHNIDELLGFTALIASRGRLLPYNSLTDAVMLKEMPLCLGLDDYGSDYLPIANCMMQQSLALQEVAKQTQRSLFEVCGFYNACALLGLVERSLSISIPSQSIPIAAFDLEVTESTPGNTSPIVIEDTLTTATESTDNPPSEHHTFSDGGFEEDFFFDFNDMSEDLIMSVTTPDKSSEFAFENDINPTSDIPASIAENLDNVDADLFFDFNEQLEKSITPIEGDVNNPIPNSPTSGRIKIVITGGFGSGKSTAIISLSDFPPIRTETKLTDAEKHKKPTTTVAMDYGEKQINDQLKVYLYGTPGQTRFSFMLPILCDNAWGMLLLVDNSESDPFTELTESLKGIHALGKNMVLAIGVTHCDKATSPNLTDYKTYINQSGFNYPVVQVDPRDKASLQNLLALIVTV